MMVTFVSQCEKKSLARTRKVLDAFADRIGSNTWQTVITQEGLLAVKKSLRKTATKNTAVSCHWIRSRSRSELVWIVGQRDKFNAQGLVPVNNTRANILRTGLENDWKYLSLIQALVALSALLHDWGKASQLFQEKLNPNSASAYKGDPIRHEWVSCLLLNAFIELNTKEANTLTDDGWLSALVDGHIDEQALRTIAIRQCKSPLAKLPPLAKLVNWLIVSHHRLPLLNDANLKAEPTSTIDDVLALIKKEWGYENPYSENKDDKKQYQARLEQCFSFPNGLMSHSKPWLKEIKKWSGRLLACQHLAAEAFNNNSYRVVLHHARLCLMLGDHYYSSQDAAKRWDDTTGLFANTDRKTKALKQKLDEHLVGVAKQGVRNAHLLPAFETEPLPAKDINALKKLSPKEYRWQDKAVDAIKKYKDINKTLQGFFVVNMASTGCGKTFANAKVMRALSDDGDSLRFILALGLRTLTLQTGDEYRQRVGLDNSELAVLIGSRAVMELHEQASLDKEKDSYENSGSLSQETLLDEDVDYDCSIPEEGLATVLTTERDRKFLYAPVLACTIDHMMGATETKRGGRYILPSLRLMSSDLVIDEIDDFTDDDLIAIGRLIHLAGMLGRKVMISSATIPPDLAEGYFNSYREGWLLYSKTREASSTIACAWIDEFTTQLANTTATDISESVTAYREQHQQFIGQRVTQLNKQPVKRKATIALCDSIFSEHKSDHNKDEVIASKQQAYFTIVLNNIFSLHKQHNTTDSKTKLTVSFGVVRVANIKPCVALTRYLLNAKCDELTEIRVMAYHSQQVLLMRHEQEQHLDSVLKRKEAKNEQPRAFSNTIIREHLDTIHCTSKKVAHVIFIVVATPVEEVGRDHDFDWAVVEPSSYRSIVQLAGRVRRHRAGKTLLANISLLQYNWRAIKGRHKDDNKAFKWPGFETGKYKLSSHNLCKLVDEQTITQCLDAIPRIKKPKEKDLQPTKKLADLEHKVTKDLLASYSSTQVGPATLQGYLREPWFLTALPQQFTPFRKNRKDHLAINAYLVWDEERDTCVFCEKDVEGRPIVREKALGIRRVDLPHEAYQRLWLKRDFETSIEKIAHEQEISRRRVSIRYGELNFPYKEGGKYEYSDQLGLVKYS